MTLEGQNDSFGFENGLVYAVNEPRDFQTLWPLAIIAAFVVATYCSNKILGNRGASRDACFLWVLSAFFCRHELFQATVQVATFIEDVWLYILPLLAINGLQLLYLLTQENSTASDTSTKHLPLKPLIFPASTAHTRMFPRHHSFQYSYLLVGVPVGWRGRIGTVFGSDEPDEEQKSRRRTPWFSVYAKDYLFYSRGTPSSQYDEGKTSHTPLLREKLDVYLRSEGVDPTDYPHAYLVTAPRVLGFSFNPVSFWYLYNSEISLQAMILEVNNTFGERRMYFLPATNDDNDSNGTNTEADKVSAEPIKRFKTKWNKDFHVSPFNDREGVYSLSASDPFVSSTATGTTPSEIKINNIITLSSPRYETLFPSPPTTASSSDDPSTSPLQTKLSPKIIASITSTTSISPSDLHTSPFTLLKFILQHLWIGFMTNPRILHEARKLWWKGLKVWFRPEPKVSTVGREETGEERIVEGCFRPWLDEVVRCCVKRRGVEVRLIYWPAAGADRGRIVVIGEEEGTEERKSKDVKDQIEEKNMKKETKENEEIKESEENDKKSPNTKTIDLKILTPEFYAESIRQSSMLAVWRDRCFNAKEGEAMVHIAPEDIEMWEEILRDYLERQSCEGGAGQVGCADASKASNVSNSSSVSNISMLSKLVDDLSAGKLLLRSLLSAVLGKITSVLRLQSHSPTTPTILSTQTTPKTTTNSNEISFRDLVHNLPSQSPVSDRSIFDNASLTILLADRLAFSSTTLLRFYGTLLRYALMIWIALRMSGMVGAFGDGIDSTGTSTGDSSEMGDGCVGGGTGVEMEFGTEYFFGVGNEVLRGLEVLVVVVMAAWIGRVSS